MKFFYEIQLTSINMEGNLIREGSFNFSIFVKQFSGLVLYAIDSFNNLLIEIEKDTVFIKLNDTISLANSQELCGCSSCKHIYATFILKTRDNILTIKCNGYTSTLAVGKIKKKANQFFGYPIPNGYKSNKTFLWMGNIGLFKGLNDMIYFPLKGQLIGCLDNFFINGKLIQFKSYGSQFSFTCPKGYNQTICNENHCSQSTVFYDMNDCSISSLNGRYCSTNLRSLNTEHSSIKLNHKLSLIRLEWMTNDDLADPCLMEMKLKNGNIILFHLDKTQRFKMIINNKQAKLFHTTQMKTLPINSTNILAANFTGTEILIKLYSEENINSFVLPLVDEVQLVNFGKSSMKGYCSDFSGLMNFNFTEYPTKDITKQSKRGQSLTETGTIFENSLKHSATTAPSTSFHKIFNNINNNISNHKLNDFEMDTVKIAVIAGIILIVLLLIMVTFYGIIRKEMRSHFKKINSLPRVKNNARDLPLPDVSIPLRNVYEFEEETSKELRNSGEYEELY